MDVWAVSAQMIHAEIEQPHTCIRDNLESGDSEEHSNVNEKTGECELLWALCGLRVQEHAL